jgi:hypothetical protein
MAAYLIDTNIWLRSVQPQSPQHLPAVEALVILLAQGHEVYMTGSCDDLSWNNPFADL